MLRERADLDVRHLLDDITAPTLIVHRSGDRLNTVDYGRYLASRLTHATYVELSGDDHLWWIPDPADVADVVTGFVRNLMGEGR